MEKFADQKILADNLNCEMSELALTKCYNLGLDHLISRVASPNLFRLDLTEALHLRDKQLL